MRKALCLFHLAFTCFAYEFSISPHIVIAGDVAGVIGEDGYDFAFDVPQKRDIVASAERPVRIELNYQTDRQRAIALAGKESFLINLKLTIGELEYNVGRIRVPQGEDSDFVVHLRIFLSDMTTSQPDHDLEEQVRRMHQFVSEKRIITFDAPSRLVIDDSLMRVPKFSHGALTPDSQLFRDVWATHMFNSLEWMVSCARAVIFPTPQNKKSQIPPKGDPASNN